MGEHMSLLVVGVIFIFMGIATGRYYHWKGVGAYIPMAIGLFMVYIVTIGPLSESRKKIEAITHLNPDQVVAISLEPSIGPSSEDEKQVKFLTISDSFMLHRVSLLLQQSVITDRSYLKNPAQVGRMKITLQDQSAIIFGLRKSEAAICLIVSSNGGDGWQYGCLKVPGLGPLLDSLAVTIP
jgi:hypothetical protein